MNCKYICLVITLVLWTLFSQPYQTYSQSNIEEESTNTITATPEIIFEEELPTDLGKLIEVLYRWKEPQSSVDEIVYKRLIKVQGNRLGCYYYSMYARCKDDILIGKGAWTPERGLMGGEDISLAIY